MPPFAKNRGKNPEKSGKKRRNREEKAKIGKVFFTLPLLTDRAGYVTGHNLNEKHKVESKGS